MEDVTNRTLDGQAAFRRFLGGDPEATERIVRRWEGAVVRLAYRITGSLEDANDVRQQVFLKLIERPRAIRRPEALGSWIYRSAVNTAINALRRRQREARHARWFAWSRPANPGRDPIEQEDFGRHVADAMAALPPKERAVAALRFEEDLTYREIAQVLEVPVSTVKSRAQNAMEKLRWKLRALQPDGPGAHPQGSMCEP